MEKQIKISILVPCHEDWNKMTPNEQGSFCGKCCKTVIDFSKKSPAEIKATLLKKKSEKVCGRFLNKQIEKPISSFENITIPYNLQSNNYFLHKAFAIALFIVFGTGLFSCQSTDGSTVGEMTIGDTTYIESPWVEDSAQVDNDLIVGKMAINENQFVDGEIEIEECNITKGDVILSPIEEKMPLGEVSIIEIPKNDTLEKHIKMGKVKIE